MSSIEDVVRNLINRAWKKEMEEQTKKAYGCGDYIQPATQGSLVKGELDITEKLLLKNTMPLPEIVLAGPLETQRRTHRKKRINKKWLKRYGVVLQNTLKPNEVIFNKAMNCIYINSSDVSTYNLIKKELFE